MHGFEPASVHAKRSSLSGILELSIPKDVGIGESGITISDEDEKELYASEEEAVDESGLVHKNDKGKQKSNSRTEKQKITDEFVPVNGKQEEHVRCCRHC